MPGPDLLGEVYVRLDEGEECVEVRGSSTDVFHGPCFT